MEDKPTSCKYGQVQEYLLYTGEQGAVTPTGEG